MATRLQSSLDEATGQLVVREVPEVPAAAQFSMPERMGHNENLAEHMSSTDLGHLGQWVMRKFNEDRDAQEGWDSMVERAYKLLGVGPESDPDHVEYENSDTSDSSLMLEAVLRFQAHAYTEMLPADRFCRSEPVIDLSRFQGPEKQQLEMDLEDTCNRVTDFFTHYLSKRLKTYVEDHDRAVFDLAMAGAAVKKIYNDYNLEDTTRVDLVSPEHLVISHDGSRVSHDMVLPVSKVARLMGTGFYRSVVLTPASFLEENPVSNVRDWIHGLQKPSSTDPDELHIVEMQCFFAMDFDPHPQGLARPYTVTIDAESETVLSVYRNWAPNDSTETRVENFVLYMMQPGASRPGKPMVFGLGLGQILSNITQTVRTGQRRSLEAAYLQNHPAGFKSQALTIRDDKTVVVPGQLVDVDSPVERISDAIYMFEYKGASPSLIAMIQELKKDGKDIVGMSIQDISQALGANTPVGTTLAALDYAQRFESAVHRRIYRGQEVEYALIQARMTEAFAGQTKHYPEGGVTLLPNDLSKVQILPAMRPGQSSRQKRILESQELVQASVRSPEVIDKRKAEITYLTALGIENLDDHILPEPEETKPADPLTEYGMALRGQGLKAGLSQNHPAHIDSHNSQMRLIANSEIPVEQGQKALATLAAHIADHMAQDMAVLVAQRMGMPLEQFAEGIPPNVEAIIAPMIAEATLQVEQIRKPEESETDGRIRIEQVKGENQIRAIDRKGAIDLRKQLLGDRADIKQNDDDNRTAKELQAMKMADNRAKEQNSPNVSTGTSTGAPTQEKNPGR